MKQFYVFVFCVFVSFYVVGQQEKIDRLFSDLEQVSNEKNQLNILYDLVRHLYVYKDTRVDSINKIYFEKAKSLKSPYHRGYSLKLSSNINKRNLNYTKAKHYSFKALTIFTSIDSLKEVHDIYYDLALIYKRDSAKIDSSIFYLDKIVNRVKEGKLLAKAYQELASNYRTNGNYQKAIEYNSRAISTSEKIGYKQSLIRATMNLGELYVDIGDKKKAINTLLKYKDSLSNNIRYINTKGAYYAKLGNAYSVNEEFEEALNSYKISIEAYQLPKKNKNSLSSQAFVYMQMSESAEALNKIDIAKKYIDNSLSALEKGNIKNSELSSGIHIAKGRIEQNKGDYEKAIYHGELAYNDLKGTTNKTGIFKTAKLLATNYDRMHNYERAFFYQKKALEQKNEIQDTELSKQATELNLKYQTEKKEKENLALKAKNAEQAVLTQNANTQKWAFGLGALILALIAGLLWWRYRSEVKAKKVISTQKDEIEQQKNLVLTLQKELHHRMKNNLSFVDMFITLAKTKFSNPSYQTHLSELQNRMHSMFEVHKQLFNKQDVTSVPAKSYLDTLIKNVQKAYTQEHIIVDNETAAAETLLANTSFPVGIILNEFMTNSYKYAFEAGKEGLIQVNLSSDAANYKLTLSDNGKGLPADFDMDRLDSFGLETIQLLTQQYEGTFSLEGHKGVRMQITLPKTAA